MKKPSTPKATAVVESPTPPAPIAVPESFDPPMRLPTFQIQFDGTNRTAIEGAIRDQCGDPNMVGQPSRTGFQLLTDDGPRFVGVGDRLTYSLADGWQVAPS